MKPDQCIPPYTNLSDKYNNLDNKKYWKGL